MNDRHEHPECASSAIALVEVAQLDLRYEGCRLKSPAAEARLLSAIAAGGIQEALQGVEVGGVRILLNGFKRLRCARKLHLATVPFVALAADETAGIVCLLRAANDHALSLLEEARFLDELKGVGGLSVAEIAQQPVALHDIAHLRATAHRTALSLAETADGVQQRGLPAAVVPAHGNALPRGQRKAHRGEKRLGTRYNQMIYAQQILTVHCATTCR